ncbi:hypothetical protein SEPCBS57363_001934 [Sporothrix epigloea]|uniref:non-specific serine/threonine protein kinase n=1 Tax=Sporothrix epigloea TaxID=1892477 RepID=A0ABP0DD07_9PEZI
MSRTTTACAYGRRTAGGRTQPMLFQTQVPISPTDRRKRFPSRTSFDTVDDLTEQLTFASLDDTLTLDHFDFESTVDAVEAESEVATKVYAQPIEAKNGETQAADSLYKPPSPKKNGMTAQKEDAEVVEKMAAIGLGNAPQLVICLEDNYYGQDVCPTDEPSFYETSSYLHEDSIDSGLRVLSWADMCPPGDRIEKIAEASYAEVYRVTNERGTSIIKAIRLTSPIRPQTKAQLRSGLVDEEPHNEEDLRGELTISEWLADIPGFVVYKERYIVRGKAPKDLLETHQTFHRRAKRQDPGRLQFYPSPSRYLEDTRFLVIELGDAGQSLENVVLDSIWQVWDVFLHVAIALARAEDEINFEGDLLQHRDLHEGNLCVRQVAEPRVKADTDKSSVVFGYSGLDITILDYGLSRAEDLDDDDRVEPIALDLEKDLSLFTSTHADQCKVYRQMRSHLLKGDRVHLPPACHQKPYDNGPDGQPISWKNYNPYTNVLWLAYLYAYLVRNFIGDKKALMGFRRATRELWQHLSPDASPSILSFPCATDIVRFAVEAGWLTEAQLVGGYGEDSLLSRHSYTGRSTVALDMSPTSSEVTAEAAMTASASSKVSIIEAQNLDRDELEPRRSPRRRRPVVCYGE